MPETSFQEETSILMKPFPCERTSTSLLNIHGMAWITQGRRRPPCGFFSHLLDTDAGHDCFSNEPRLMLLLVQAGCSRDAACESCFQGSGRLPSPIC